MENNLEGKKNNSSLKAVIAVLAILLVGSLVYMYKINNNSKIVEKKLTTEKESVMNDLQKLKATYDVAIAENTTLSDELVKERTKVVKLIEDLKKSKRDVTALSKYKGEYKRLETKMKSLIAENEVLKQENKLLTTERDSTRLELGVAKKYNDTLITQNENLSKTVAMASNLSVLNLKGEGLKERSSGKQTITDKASRANKLKICFTIAENRVAKSGEKVFYIQVIDPKNNVLGENNNISFGEQSLVYSFSSIVGYQNETIDVCEFIYATKKLEKGTYVINVFDEKNLVSKSSFTLR